MYIDEYVIAGIAIVVLTMSLFGGFYVAIKKDIEKHGDGSQSN